MGKSNKKIRKVKKKSKEKQKDSSSSSNNVFFKGAIQFKRKPKSQTSKNDLSLELQKKTNSAQQQNFNINDIFERPSMKEKNRSSSSKKHKKDHETEVPNNRIIMSNDASMLGPFASMALPSQQQPQTGLPSLGAIASMAVTPPVISKTQQTSLSSKLKSKKKKNEKSSTPLVQQQQAMPVLQNFRNINLPIAPFMPPPTPNRDDDDSTSSSSSRSEEGEISEEEEESSE